MPFALQVHHISKYLTNRSINPHGSELDDLLDPTLHYDENKAIICKHYGLYEGQASEKELILDQAQRRDAERSTHSQMTDYHIKALKVRTLAELEKDPEKFEAWLNNPERTDIKGVDVKDSLLKSKKRQSTQSSSINSIELKERTIGILGQKGTGKTYLTRALINSFKDHCVIFDTIGAFKKQKLKAQNFEVVPKDIEKQAIAWGVISTKTKQNVAVDLSRLTQKEIITFTDIALKTAEYKNKNVFVDEIADYIPESAKKSQEMERLIRHGRNEGNTFFFNTQRPAQISKNTLNLVDILIVFRLVWNRDIEVLEELFNSLALKNITGEIHKITNQGVGEYQLYSFHIA